MKVIVKRVGQDPTEIIIPNELYILQSLVGGYIETVTLASDLVLICDEEGKVKGKKHNCTVFGEPFCGDILLVGRKRDKFCDVPITVERCKKVRMFV